MGAQDAIVSKVQSMSRSDRKISPLHNEGIKPDTIRFMEFDRNVPRPKRGRRIVVRIN